MTDPPMDFYTPIHFIDDDDNNNNIMESSLHSTQNIQDASSDPLPQPTAHCPLSVVYSQNTAQH